MFRGGLLALVFLSAGHSFGAEKIWFLHGRVVDQEGQPVAGASVATVWNSNGVTLERLRKSENDGKPHPEFTMNEGQLEPWGEAPARTNANGTFSIELRSSHECKLMAVDKEHRRGGLVFFDPRHPPAHVECKLVPLARVHGRVRVAATGEPERDVSVVASVPDRQDFPLGRCRLAVCSSLKSRFEFWLPPGDYRFEAYGHDPPRLELIEAHPIKLKAGQRDLDCGVHDLSPVSRIWYKIEDAKKSGTWRALAQRYGQPCPKWHAIDSRGMRKDAQPSNFRGKWVLLYLWSPSCGPCVERTLPKLREFYEGHKNQRDRFELVSVCVEPETNMESMADLDRELKPIVKVVWGGKELPFPVALDNSFATMENFGVEFFGATLLIDPAGRLVKGDETTLATILKNGDRDSSRKQ